MREKTDHKNSKYGRFLRNEDIQLVPGLSFVFLFFDKQSAWYFEFPFTIQLFFEYLIKAHRK